MTELRTVAAADRFRVFQDALRRRDQQQAEVQRTQTQSFDERARTQELIQADVRLAERRVQDRRDLVEAERARQDEFLDQQRVRDRISSDESFVRRQDGIDQELDGIRDNRELNESLLLRDIAGQRNNAAELNALDQRNEDLRAQLLDREARLVERRRQERVESIRQEADLRRSLERIRASAQEARAGGAAEQPRGAVLDVAG